MTDESEILGLWDEMTRTCEHLLKLAELATQIASELGDLKKQFHDHMASEHKTEGDT